MACGLSGNIFTLDFQRYGHLAEHSWFKHKWQLCWLFNVQLYVTPMWDFSLVRDGDRSIMKLFADLNIYSTNELNALNWVRCYKKAFFVSDLVLADGQTLDPDQLLHIPDDSLKHFSLEHPLPHNIALWKSAVGRLFTPAHRLHEPLGNFLTSPNCPFHWQVSDSRQEIYRIHSRGDRVLFDTYRCSPEHRNTRNRNVFQWMLSSYGDPPSQTLASLRQLDLNMASFHSLATTTVTVAPISLRQVINSWENPSLWNQLIYDGDGSWITAGLARGLIVAVSDGS